jgi:tetratricopeptide (TPR) repeat protein
MQTKYLFFYFGLTFKVLLVLLLSLLNVSCRSVHQITPQPYYQISKDDSIEEAEYLIAIKRLSRIIKRDPMNADALTARGYCFLKVGEYEKALNDFNESIKTKPSFEGYIQRSRLHRDLGNYEEVLKDLRRAEEIDTDNRLFDYEMGSFYALTEHFPEAIQSFEKALVVGSADFIKKHNFACYLGIGDSYYMLKDYKSALDNFYYALMIFPDNCIVHKKIGNAYAGLNDFEKSIEHYTIAISFNPDFMEAYYNRGNVYFTIHKYDEAIQDYKRAEYLLEEKETLIINYTNLSRLLFLTERYRESIEYGNKILKNADVVDLGVFYYIAKYNMAISYLNLSEPETAYELYDECFSDGFLRNTNLVNQVTDDLISHYNKGLHKEIVKNIFLDIIKFSEEEFYRKVNKTN